MQNKPGKNCFLRVLVYGNMALCFVQFMMSLGPMVALQSNLMLKMQMETLMQ
nr:MAG TPA: hypothetical protein [Caudoviricetes sp.]